MKYTVWWFENESGIVSRCYRDFNDMRAMKRFFEAKSAEPGEYKVHWGVTKHLDWHHDNAVWSYRFGDRLDDSKPFPGWRP